MQRIDIEKIGYEDVFQFVAFKIQQKRFAIEIGHVREIIRYQKASPLPKVPEFLDGVIDLRGEIIPIIDLRKRFGADVKYELKTRILIVRSKGKTVGLVADEASEVISVNLKNVKPVPIVTKFYDVRYIIGMITYKGNIYFIVEVDALLTEQEKLSIEKLTVV
jgi:purine-binding chemotaxis protein CheW